VAESWRTRLTRWRFNWFPAYRATGARITYVAADWSEVRIRLPLTRRTRNYVGTIFGGSMYAATDPVYMVMLIKILGSSYIVWDKAATIRFRRPGRQPLFATFRLTPGELQTIRAEVNEAGKAEREFTVDLIDAAGDVHATVQKLVSIQRRRAARRSSGGRASHSP
jgi:acyl-coenzyme A thioesterase PaaI-like protein